MLAVPILNVTFLLGVAASAIGLIAWLLAGAPDLQPRSVAKFRALVAEDEGWYPEEPVGRPQHLKESA